MSDKLARKLREAAERKGVLGKTVKGMSWDKRHDQHKAIMKKLPNANTRKALWTMGLDEDFSE